MAARLAGAGLEIPPTTPPDAAFVPAVQAGDLVYTAGQLPFRGGTLVASGRLGETITIERGRECAQLCALAILAELAAFLGDLDHVRRVVKLTVYVASSPTFTGQPEVADAASELMVLAFGDAGLHARSAIGVAALPFGSPVEVEAVVQIRPPGSATTRRP